MRRNLILAAVLGFVVGVLWLAAIRFFTITSDSVHYHANFAVYVNGQREEFDNFSFYEEVQACSDDELNNPRSRVHMHDQINHVVHVHDHAATWGHFFANLNFALGQNVLKTADGVYVDGQDGKQLSFILNGQEIQSPANLTIGNEDALLINYGDEDDETLQARYNEITRDAAEYNQRDDPSACKGAQELTVGERLRRAFGFGD